MRIAIIAPGSRGDVQPYVALGKGLQEAGQTVRLVTHRDYETLVVSDGLEFWPMVGDVQEIVQTQAMRDRIEGGNILRLMAQVAKEGERRAIELAEGGLSAARGMDLLLAGIGGIHIALALAEGLDLPCVQAYLFPFTPTRHFAGVLASGIPGWLGGSLNRLSHHLGRQLMWQVFRSADKQMRKKVLGLSPAPFLGPYRADQTRDRPILYGFSPAVIPPPPDWGEQVHVTGYWFLDSVADWTPPETLTSFLDSGAPPVYVGFGSMSQRRPEETTKLVIEALRQINGRAILLSGWGGLQKKDLPNSVLMIDSVPHSWLFSRVSAVVHHGGAGTTAAGLRAGVPSIVIPFFGDQPFWGRRVAELGVGPDPIPRKNLTAERLACAIQRAVNDQGMRQRAADLGRKIRAEDGVARAVEIITEPEPTPSPDNWTDESPEGAAE
jgi:UDP:flavonoid glycosyltransferase YjiC (YdhE family)